MNERLITYLEEEDIEENEPDFLSNSIEKQKKKYELQPRDNLTFNVYFPHLTEMKQKLYSEDLDEVIESLTFFDNFLKISDEDSKTKETSLIISDLHIIDRFLSIFIQDSSPATLIPVINILNELSYSLTIPIPTVGDTMVALADRIIQLFDIPDPDTIDSLLSFAGNLCKDNVLFGSFLLEKDVLLHTTNYAILDFPNIEEHQKHEALFVRSVIHNGCLEIFHDQIRAYFVSLFLCKTYTMDLEICRFMLKMCRLGIDYEFSKENAKYLHQFSVKPVPLIKALLLVLSLPQFVVVRNMILDTIFLDNICGRIIQHQHKELAFPLFSFLTTALDAYIPGPNDLVFITAYNCIYSGTFSEINAALEYLFFLLDNVDDLNIARIILEAGFLPLFAEILIEKDPETFEICIDILHKLIQSAMIADVDISGFQCFDTVMEALSEIANNAENGDESEIGTFAKKAQIILDELSQ